MTAFINEADLEYCDKINKDKSISELTKLRLSDLAVLKGFSQNSACAHAQNIGMILFVVIE